MLKPFLSLALTFCSLTMFGGAETWREVNSGPGHINDYFQVERHAGFAPELKLSLGRYRSDAPEKILKGTFQEVEEDGQELLLWRVDTVATVAETGQEQPPARLGQRTVQVGDEFLVLLLPQEDKKVLLTVFDEKKRPLVTKLMAP